MTRNGTPDDGEPPDPLIRPKGFVADEAVVRRIGDRDCYLGNALAADPDAHGRSFDFVLSATAEELPLTTHHRPLVDGRGNEWAAFAAAVDTARTLYRRDGSVLVNCKAGVSRSATLLAATIAAEEDRRFREALAIVQDARPFAMPNPALHELAVVYLAARS
ncbi:dual specificity protein phosphatase family protein [Halostella litorea]|uniref:dual specificity protein phosphatase family protein n=1 Tax=Halostella litorea TaxID=2528831 RepID=UPI0010925A63|nr:dual specificity protein phosphatase family protein [Halostella litorea]